MPDSNANFVCKSIEVASGNMYDSQSLFSSAAFSSLRRNEMSKVVEGEDDTIIELANNHHRGSRPSDGQ